MDRIPTELLQAAFLGTAAGFGGLGMTLNLVAAPAALASSDPLPVFVQLYERGKNLAMKMILSSAVCGGLLFYKTEDRRYLAAAILNLLVIPYTIKFMMGTNNALFKMEKEAKTEETPKAKKLIKAWGGYQWVRTLLGVSAFALGVHAVLIKK